MTTSPSLAKAGRDWTAYHHLMWFWCWACFRAYMALPSSRTHRSRYGRFMLWLLGHAGAYAHSDRSNFHLCSYFCSSSDEQEEAVANWIATPKTEAGK